MEKEKIEEIKMKMLQWLREAEEYIHKVPQNQLYIAIGVVLFTIILFLISNFTYLSLSFSALYLLKASCFETIGRTLLFNFFRQKHNRTVFSRFDAARLFKRKSSNTIILTGLSGSGKTVLFYQIRDGSSHQGTVTSMEPNEGTFTLASETMKKGKIKPVHVVDFPGHSRLRPKLDEFLPQAAAIVFVVDAVEFLPNCRAASEYLYDILTNVNVVKKKIPVLLLCNKVDKVTAHTKEFMRKQLEKEIDKLRASRTAVSTADITSEITLGVPGEAFSFSQCHNKVVVGEASGLTGETSQLEQFIRGCVSP